MISIKQRGQSLLFLWVGVFYGSLVVAEVPEGGRVPADIESWGGMGGLSGGQSAGVEGLAAVRLNPSRLQLAQSYEIHGAYHWPSYGKSFYQLGVVDGTSAVKAGLLFTAPLKVDFADPYAESEPSSEGEFVDDPEERSGRLWGTRLRQRFNLGLSYSFGMAAVGITGTYVKGWMRRHRHFKFSSRDGVTFGLGLSAQVLPSLSLGASTENLSNSSIKDLAPTFYRGGVAWSLLEGLVVLAGDYVHRQRVRSEWVLVSERESSEDRGWNSLFDRSDELSRYEKMVRVSSSLVIQNLMRLSIGYGHEVGSHSLKRRSLAASLALTSDIYALIYELKRPYLKDKNLDQKVELSVKIKI